jgi:hypothetical protein
VHKLEGGFAGVVGNCFAVVGRDLICGRGDEVFTIVGRGGLAGGWSWRLAWNTFAAKILETLATGGEKRRFWGVGW